jgi:hypothetical protein
MKDLLIGMLVFSACSEKPDYTPVEQKLSLVRDQAQKQYYLDSLESLLKLKDNLEITNNYTKEYTPDSIKNILKIQGEVFAREYNKEYDIKKDRAVTLQTYLDYCKAHNHDPLTYYKFMN